MSKIIENNCYHLKTGLPNAADVAIMVLDKPIPNAVEGTDYVTVWDTNDRGSIEGKDFTLVGWGGAGPVGTNPGSG